MTLRLFCTCATGLVLLGAPAAAHAALAGVPQIVSFTATVGSGPCAGSTGGRVSCPSQGGVVTLALTVKGAISCTLFRRPDPTSTPIRWKAIACSSSVVHLRAPVAANSGSDVLKVGFVVRARARSGATATRTVSVTVAGAPAVEPADPTPPAPQPLAVPPLQPPWPFPSGSDGKSSANWAGYWVGGGPFTAVRGTFNVPNVTSTPGSDPDVSEWVGIDGADNPSLIQAGILETYDPVKKTVAVSAWWEILPALATPVEGFQVGLGDQVTVVIWQVSGSTWAIDINDDTNGQHFQTTQTYTGPATSAEWILEAPTTDAGKQETIGLFNPNVIFRNNRFTGTTTVKVMVQMVQRGLVTVIPSPMNANDDFAVGSGGMGAPTP